jgi:hypothetical protein
MSSTTSSQQPQQPQEDYLEVDPPIPGQNYVCLSFVSPEDMIKKRSLFEVRQFIESVFARVHITDADAEADAEADLDKEKSKIATFDQLKGALTMDGYLDYAVKHEAANERLFNEQNDYKTSVRGVKVRGTFDTLKEAQRKAKVLQGRDPTFNVFVGAMGYWLPWDPNPDNVENQEFANQQLNEIVKKYKENKQSKDEVWENDVRLRIEKTKADGLAGANAAAAAAAAAAPEELPELAQSTTVKVIAAAAEESNAASCTINTIFEENEDVFLSRKQKEQLASYSAF